MQHIEQVDAAVKKLLKDVTSNPELVKNLESAPTWQDRWMLAENHVLDNLLGSNHISYYDFNHLWIRELFFYQMQQDTKMDFGFCEYFTPAFRERAEDIIMDNYSGYSHDPTRGMNLCNIDGKVNLSTCSGTDRDHCVIYHALKAKV